MANEDLERRGGTKSRGNTYPPTYYSPSYFIESTEAMWTSWLVPMIVVANVGMFIVIMYFNNCPKNNSLGFASGTCVAKFLGRLSFEPLRENPLFGPSSSTQRLGSFAERRSPPSRRISTFVKISISVCRFQPSFAGKFTVDTEKLSLPMDNNECSDSTMDLFEAFVALQEVVSSINYVCGVYIIVLQVALERYQSRLDIKRSPHPFQAQLDYLNRLVKDSDIDCHEQLRVNRHTFMCLCTLVRSVGLSDSKYVLLEEKVAMFLNVIAHDYKNRNIKFNFMRSGQTVSQYFNDVLKAILRLQGVLLKTPEPITANCTDDRWRCFQNCLGALDGTYVRVRVPAIDKPRYRTRKGEIATNVLGVCSQDMQFIYVLPGWEGSASDSRVLRDAVNRPNGLKVPTGFYYLVDAGYTNGEGFLAPYRGQRYHLSTWREGGIPVNPEEFFNMKHSAARNVIERCFGLLKIRWAILRTASYYPIKTQGRIITACCLLHNLIRREMPVDPFEFELNNTPIPQPDLGEEFINTVEPSNQWSDWRDTLANIMFNEWQANRGVGGNPP